MTTSLKQADIGQYMNHMLSINQKPAIDTQKLKRKEHKHTTKKDHKEIK